MAKTAKFLQQTDRQTEQVDQHSYLQLLYDFSASLIEIMNLDELLWHVARRVVGQLGFGDCVIYLMDNDSNSILQQAAIGEKNPQGNEIANRLRIPVGRGITGRVAASGKTLLTGDVSTQEDYIADTVEGMSELCVPIICDGEILGVIDSEDPRPNYYTAQHQQFLESVASLLGSKIRQVRLTEKLHREEKIRAGLLEISAIVHGVRNTVTYCDRLRQILAELIPIDDLLVGYYEVETNRLRFPYVYEDGDVHYDRLEWPALDGPDSPAAYLMWQEGPLFLNEEEYQRLVREGRLRPDAKTPQSWLGVEYEIDDELRGVLIARNFRSEQPCSRADLEVLELAGTCVSDAFLHRRAEKARLRAQSDLAASESLLRSIIEHSPMPIVLKSVDGRYLAVGSTFRKAHGVSPDDVIGRDHFEVADPVAGQIHRDLEQHVREHKSIISREFEQRYSDGKKLHIAVTKFPILDSAGDLTAIGSIGVDVTEQRLTEQKLLQSQRLEVVGQLTGGIAHDFNNLLMAIVGGVDQARELGHNHGDLLPVLDLIERAADHGADLTRRLTAFSTMQILDPAPVDLNTLVENAAELIRHSIGSNIQFSTHLDADLWPAMVDPGQLEHALLNLAINAKDAMADGGRLTIETINSDSDDHHLSDNSGAEDRVIIRVSDTGSGMSADVQAKAFEPFFTTKEVGKGSGLGLSMVFGFVKQSGGHLHLQSDPGAGTIIQLCLPRAVLPPAEESDIEATQRVAVIGNAKILVVEDDENIRYLLQRFLDGFGYSAQLFEDGPSAVAALDHNAADFDLLITDMLLPDGMNGRQVAAEFMANNADGRVLYISGYAPDTEINDGKLDDGHDFLAKPFTRKALQRRVADILQR